MTIFTAVLAVAATAALAAGCSTGQAAEAPPEPRPVKTEAVALTTSSAGIRYSAAIEAFAEVPLAFKAAGYIDGVLMRRGADGRMRAAQAGDAVERGTRLAHVREAEYAERVNQSHARVAEAEASLEKARLDLARARTLFAAQSLTRPDLDGAQAAYDAGAARVAAARADIALAAAALADTSLTVPSSGILLDRRIEIGSLVSAGSVGFVLGDVTAVKARFGIPDAMIRSVSPGELIELAVEAVAAAPFQGVVTAIAPAADPQSRVFTVEVTVPNRDGRLRPGMIGAVAIRPQGRQPTGAGGAVPTVPLTAIVRSVRSAGSYAAFVIERQGETDTARLRDVQLGEVIGNGIAVAGGLNPGERVVVTGASLLVDGDAVRVIP